jgi:hypothetical protein
MKDEKEIRYQVINHRSQPTELHLGERVLVLPPHGQTEVTESEATVPQLKLMVRRRLVSLVPILSPAPAQEQPAPKKKPRSRKKAGSQAGSSAPDKGKAQDGE